MGDVLDALHHQVRAWNDGDLEAYLWHVHPEVLYQHGETVLHGVEALRAHYEGRVTGTLEVRVVQHQQLGDTTVMAVLASLGTWKGSALLTWVHRDGRWLLVADATDSG